MSGKVTKILTKFAKYRFKSEKQLKKFYKSLAPKDKLKAIKYYKQQINLMEITQNAIPKS